MLPCKWVHQRHHALPDLRQTPQLAGEHYNLSLPQQARQQSYHTPNLWQVQLRKVTDGELQPSQQWLVTLFMRGTGSRLNSRQVSKGESCSMESGWGRATPSGLVPGPTAKETPTVSHTGMGTSWTNMATRDSTVCGGTGAALV